MATQQSSGVELLEALFQLCGDKATGTFFVATEDNRSCQIVIAQGQLTKASFAQNLGLAALIAFKGLKTGRFSFTEKLELPMDASAAIEQSTEALEFLGYDKFLQAQSEVETEPTADTDSSETEAQAVVKTERRVVRMYRGQPIYEDVKVTETPEANAAPIPEKTAPKKPVRMYRGRVVD